MAEAERPYIDRPIVDRDAATTVAQIAARRWAADIEPVPLRFGMNALYAVGDAVLRVGRATAPALVGHQVVEVVAAHGVPTVQPIAGWAADLNGYAVTGWQRIQQAETGRVADGRAWERIGAAVAAVHRIERRSLPDGFPIPSPQTFPWWDFDSMLAATRTMIDDAAWQGLAAAVDRGRSWTIDVAEGTVVCHGDVHPGNVLMSGDDALLIDWDLMCWANPAWDHAMLVTNARRWGGPTWVYDAFASGYGSSLADDPLTETLGELRNAAATLMKVRAGVSDALAATEAERRLRYWRGDPDAPTWVAQ